MEPSLKEVLSHFQTQGEVVSCERYGCGHINETTEENEVNILKREDWVLQ